MRLFFLQALVVTGVVLAQENQAQSTTGLASFLKRGFSARWVGMGGAPIALVNDATSIYWNPAGLVNGKIFQLNLSRADETVFSDLKYNQFAFSLSNHASQKYHIGIGMGYMDTRVDGIDLYDAEANYISSSQYYEAIILGGLALSMGGLKIGFAHLNYMVNNLGVTQSTTLNMKKDFIILGLQYYIFKGLNVGVTIRNKTELLPREYLEGERKIGISYTQKRRNSEDDWINFGMDFNKVEYGGLLSSGVEFFPFKKAPLKGIAVRTGIANVKITGTANDKILDYRQKLTFGIGYVHAASDKWKFRFSASISQHTHPSISESFSDPFSRNTLISISIE